MAGFGIFQCWAWGLGILATIPMLLLIALHGIPGIKNLKKIWGTLWPWMQRASWGSLGVWGLLYGVILALVHWGVECSACMPPSGGESSNNITMVAAALAVLFPMVILILDQRGNESNRLVPRYELYLRGAYAYPLVLGICAIAAYVWWEPESGAAKGLALVQLGAVTFMVVRLLLLVSRRELEQRVRYQLLYEGLQHVTGENAKNWKEKSLQKEKKTSLDKYVIQQPWLVERLEQLMNQSWQQNFGIHFAELAQPMLFLLETEEIDFEEQYQIKDYQSPYLDYRALIFDYFQQTPYYLKNYTEIEKNNFFKIIYEIIDVIITHRPNLPGLKAMLEVYPKAARLFPERIQRNLNDIDVYIHFILGGQINSEYLEQMKDLVFRILADIGAVIIQQTQNKEEIQNNKMLQKIYALFEKYNEYNKKQFIYLINLAYYGNDKMGSSQRFILSPELAIFMKNHFEDFLIAFLDHSNQSIHKQLSDWYFEPIESTLEFVTHWMPRQELVLQTVFSDILPAQKVSKKFIDQLAAMDAIQKQLVAFLIQQKPKNMWCQSCQAALFPNGLPDPEFTL